MLALPYMFVCIQRCIFVGLLITLDFVSCTYDWPTIFVSSLPILVVVYEQTSLLLCFFNHSWCVMGSRIAFMTIGIVRYSYNIIVRDSGLVLMQQWRLVLCYNFVL